MSAISICDPQLRDVWTKIIVYIANPAPLRGCCKGTVAIWEHTLYLEGELPCPLLFQPTFHLNTESTPTLGPPIPFQMVSQRHQLEGSKVSLLRIPGLQSLTGSLPITLRTLHLCQLPHLTKMGFEQLSRFADTTSQPRLMLTEVIIEDLPELIEMCERAFACCHHLERFTLRRLPKLKATPENLLEECGSSNAPEQHGQLIVEDLPSLCTIGRCTFYDTALGGSVTLASFPKLTEICDFLFYRNSRVVHVVLKDLPELTSLGSSFLDDCGRLETVHISNLPKLHTIHRDFLCCCRALILLEIEGLLSLEEFGGGGWVNVSHKLKTFRLKNLPRLRTIKSLFVDGREHLSELSLEDLPLLQDVEEDLPSHMSQGEVTLNRVPKFPQAQITGFKEKEAISLTITQ